MSAARAGEVRFETGAGLALAGTLQLPDRDPVAPPGEPAVVLVLGSYPALRDGNSDHRQGWFSPGAPKRNLLLHVAAALAGHGVASLRYDKRGCGASEGSYDDVDFEALVEDIGSAVAALRSTPEIDGRRIGLLGQSEGGILVLEAAVRDPAIAAVLAQGSPGRRLFETRSDEAASLVGHVDRMPAAQRGALIDEAPGSYLFMKYRREMQRAVAAGEHRLTMVEGAHRIVLNLDWIRQHLAHPADELARQLRCPVAFFAGERDLNVHPENAEHLAAVCRAADNPSVTLRIFPGLDHGFRSAPADTDDGMTAMATMESSAPVDSGYLEAVASWLATRLAGPPR